METDFASSVTTPFMGIGTMLLAARTLSIGLPSAQTSTQEPSARVRSMLA
jgi:hypothetical protein